MTLTKELADYLEDETSLTVGTDLFAGAAPADAPDSHNVIIDSGGAANGDLSDYKEKTVQILSKSSDYFVALSYAEEIYAALHCRHGITLGSYYAGVVKAITLPQSVGQDEKGLYTISTNYVLKAQDA